ncbi:hypothetical protein SynPROSU1_01972 [Synechococcus sp. PROS-U-1]|nr:hypothetical protein SynPROSU1_01972 [Synechococcus sp. PROS-U-1]
MQKGNNLLIRGVDSVNNLMRGVNKNDLLANYPDTCKSHPPSASKFYRKADHQHSQSISLCCKNQPKNNQEQALFKR